MSFYHMLLLIQLGSLAITETKAATTYTCNYELDLAFLVDESGSICNDQPGPCDNWRACVAFIHNIVNNLIIGPNDVRVALTLFESGVWPQWNLSTYSNKSDLLNAIDNLRYSGGNTNTIGALDSLAKTFSAAAGDRSGIRNQVILVTDGKPRIGADPYPLDQIQAAVKRVTDQGIRLIVVGVTNSIDMGTLTNLSSPPHTINETVFFVQDYKSLGTVLDQLEIQNCKNITDPIPPFTAADPAQCTQQLDLCFVVDASGSICDGDEGFDYETDSTCNNWNFNLDFIRNVVNYFDVGPQQTRIGLVIFSTNSYVAFNLTTYTNKPALLNAISNITYHKGGTTDMSGGIHLMRTVFGHSDNRPDVYDTAIVMTDGYPTVPSTLQPEIDACRQSGIRILAVGITDKIDLNTIKRLAYPPPKENVSYFLSASYASLEGVTAQLSTMTCATPPPQSTPPQSTPPRAPDIPLSPTTRHTSTIPLSTADGVVTPPPKTAAPSCNDAAVDLCFLIDASGSICDTDPAFDYDTDSTCNNWNLILQFLQRIVNDIFTSPFTRVGLVKFSSTAQTVFNLTRYTSQSQLMSAIGNLTYAKGGTTDMTGALHEMRTNVFNTSGDRTGYSDVAVILSDGYPTQPSTLQAEIDAAQNSGIHILPLGVTNKVDETTLRRMSDPPHQVNVTYFMALNYIDIESFREALQDSICSQSI